MVELMFGLPFINRIIKQVIINKKILNHKIRYFISAIMELLHQI